MILVGITINGTLYRISVEDLVLEHFWENLITSIMPIRYALSNNAGGYVDQTFGGLGLSPALFREEWPPPKKCAVTFQMTDTDEASAVTLFAGNMYRNGGLGETEIKYDFYGGDHTAELSDSTIIDGTLDDVFATYCGESHLNKTLVNTYSRLVSPSVYGVFAAGTAVIDMLHVLSLAVNHLFYMSESDLHLVDMLRGNGSAMEIADEDPFEAVYSDYPLIKSFNSNAVKQYSIPSTNPGVGEKYDSEAAQFIEHLYGRIGDNSGNDRAMVAHTSLIQYETGKYYLIKIKARQSSGSGLYFFAGVLGVAADRATLVNISGADLSTGQHWFVSNTATLGADWSTHEGYASGWSNPGISAERPTVGTPATLHTDVVYFRPAFVVNSSSGAGECDIDLYEVWEVDSGGNKLALLFRDDFSAGFSGEWIKYSGTTEERETTTSEAESVTNVEAALGDLKTILESQRATIKLPLVLSRVPRHGQSISWTDNKVGPAGCSVDVEIKARTITLNVSKHRVEIEGEGILT